MSTTYPKFIYESNLAYTTEKNKHYTQPGSVDLCGDKLKDITRSQCINFLIMM